MVVERKVPMREEEDGDDRGVLVRLPPRVYPREDPECFSRIAALPRFPSAT